MEIARHTILRKITEIIRRLGQIAELSLNHIKLILYRSIYVCTRSNFENTACPITRY